MNGFVDGPTRSFTMVDEILRPFSPKTSYGRRSLDDFSCVLTSQEQFLSHWARLEKVLALSPESVERMEKILEKVPDLSHQIAHGFVDISDFAKLKRFVFNFMLLSKIADRIWDLPDTGEFWKVLSHFFGEGEALQLQSETLLNLRKTHFEITQQLKEEFSRLCDRMYSLVGLRPRDEEFTVSVEIGRKLAEANLAQLLKDYGERWHMRLIDTEKAALLKRDLEALEARMQDETEKLLKDIGRQIEGSLDLLRACERTIETIDLDLSRYRMYFAYKCCRPEVGENLCLVKGKFVPTLNYCEQNGYEYYPIDLEAKSGVTVLCGPNMGGKTTALRTVGAFVLLFQLGYPVPAERFKSPIFNAIRFVSRGEEIGLSSFAMEIRNLVKAMNLAGRKLLLLDEFGASTNPIEGEALALAVVEHFSVLQDYVFLTTHYPRVVLKAEKVYGCGRIKNIDEDDPHKMFDYSLVPNVKHVEKIGLMIAGKLGLPSEMLEKARKHCGVE